MAREPKPKGWVTAKELADELGITLQAIHKARGSGRIPPQAWKYRDGRTSGPIWIHRKKALDSLENSTVMDTTGGAGDDHSGDGNNYNKMRTLNEKLKAQLRALDIAQRKGELVRTEDAVKAFGPVLEKICAALDALPSRIARTCAGQNEDDIERIVKGEARQIRESAQIEFSSRAKSVS